VATARLIGANGRPKTSGSGRLLRAEQVPFCHPVWQSAILDDTARRSTADRLVCDRPEVHDRLTMGWHLDVRERSLRRTASIAGSELHCGVNRMMSTDGSFHLMSADALRQGRCTLAVISSGNIPG